MSGSAILELKSVTSGYGRKVVIRDVSLSVETGSVVTLLGANGVGKTTTLRTITGQINPMRGQLFYHGQDITRLKPHRIAALGMGYSPEGRRVFGNLSVYENLMVGAYRVSAKAEFRRHLEWVYQLFPRLKERRAQSAESLSGGEQQMLAIGRALISRPELLLLDEPSLGLAPLVVTSIGDTLTQINGTGVSMLLVEQNANLALGLAHYGFVMDKGEIVHSGTSDELKTDDSIADIYLGFDEQPSLAEQ